MAVDSITQVTPPPAPPPAPERDDDLERELDAEEAERILEHQDDVRRQNSSSDPERGQNVDIEV